MNSPCPNCTYGTLKPARVTFVREWAGYMVTLPNVAAWRCDSCTYTRYDPDALARLELLLGPDVDAMMVAPFHPSPAADGPDLRRPHRRYL